MAKRQAVYKYDSSEVQGEESYVKMRAIPYRMIREIIAMRESGDEMTIAQAEEKIRELVIDSLREWDWVDDDGKPLPLPDQGLNFDEDLLAHEATFLMECLTGEHRAKN